MLGLLKCSQETSGTVQELPGVFWHIPNSSRVHALDSPLGIAGTPVLLLLWVEVGASTGAPWNTAQQRQRRIPEHTRCSHTAPGHSRQLLSRAVPC